MFTAKNNNRYSDVNKHSCIFIQRHEIKKQSKRHVMHIYCNPMTLPEVGYQQTKLLMMCNFIYHF